MNIILIGYMGSGKTTLGKKLAKRLNLRFIDTDKFIEERQESTISSLFEKNGEAAFRQLEKELIDELMLADNMLISTGGGLPCFSKCETIHKTEEWEKYTLLDFCEILGLKTDETNKMGDYIPKGHYYQFISLINRFNRLLEKLYCQDCNHILYPSDFGTGHFAAHTVVRFQCRNDECSNNDEIYLNHCLNGQCNCIIDSRVSKRCDNGLFICDNCGSCCSHNMLERRLSNLKLTGGYIHDYLVKCVNEKLGHLERGEYFCYKCRSEMTEISNDIFQCSNCNVKYDTTKYKIKKPHIHLRKKKTTTENNGNDNESDDFNFPF